MDSIIHNLHQWVAYIFNFVIPLLIKLIFKRKNDQHFVDKLFDIIHSTFFPRPYLGRNIVDHPEVILLCPLGHSKVKSRIVDENKNVRLKSQDVPLAKAKVAEYGAQ